MEYIQTCLGQKHSVHLTPSLETWTRCHITFSSLARESYYLDCQAVNFLRYQRSKLYNSLDDMKKHRQRPPRLNVNNVRNVCFGCCKCCSACQNTCNHWPFSPLQQVSFRIIYFFYSMKGPPTIFIYQILHANKLLMCRHQHDNQMRQIHRHFVHFRDQLLQHVSVSALHPRIRR